MAHRSRAKMTKPMNNKPNWFSVEMISNERTKKSKKHAKEAKRNETKEITLWLEYWAFAYRHKQKWEWTVEHTLKCCGAHNFPFYFKCPRYGLRQPKCIAKTFRLRRWCVRASVRTNDRIFLCRCVIITVVGVSMLLWLSFCLLATNTGTSD